MHVYARRQGIRYNRHEIVSNLAGEEFSLRLEGSVSLALRARYHDEGFPTLFPNLAHVIFDSEISLRGVKKSAKAQTSITKLEILNPEVHEELGRILDYFSCRQKKSVRLGWPSNLRDDIVSKLFFSGHRFTRLDYNDNFTLTSDDGVARIVDLEGDSLSSLADFTELAPSLDLRIQFLTVNFAFFTAEEIGSDAILGHVTHLSVVVEADQNLQEPGQPPVRQATLIHDEAPLSFPRLSCLELFSDPADRVWIDSAAIVSFVRGGIAMRKTRLQELVVRFLEVRGDRKLLDGLADRIEFRVDA